MVQNILKQHFFQLFQTVTVNGFSPRHPFGKGITKRPVRPATLYFYGPMNQKKVTQKIAHNIKLLGLGLLD